MIQPRRVVLLIIELISNPPVKFIDRYCILVCMLKLTIHSYKSCIGVQYQTRFKIRSIIQNSLETHTVFSLISFNFNFLFPIHIFFCNNDQMKIRNSKNQKNAGAIDAISRFPNFDGCLYKSLCKVHYSIIKKYFLQLFTLLRKRKTE